jgi:hypothetical protein
MGDGVGVPAFGEHGHRHDAADGFAQPTRLAHGVHGFAKQILIRQVLGLAGIASALNDLAAEPLDFIGGHGAEVVIQGFARL